MITGHQAQPLQTLIVRYALYVRVQVALLQWTYEHTTYTPTVVNTHLLFWR